MTNRKLREELLEHAIFGAVILGIGFWLVYSGAVAP